MVDSNAACFPSGDSLSLETKIRDTFRQLGYSQLNAIKCSSIDGEICLSGELDSFYLKQVAQSVAIKVSGKQNVQNQIQVS
jgi:osmotically-inducible protein OsmY